MLTRFAAPAASPVSLTEAKAHLAVTHALDDTIIQLYLDAAVAHLDGAEGVLGRCLVTQTWDYVLDAFGGEITVPLPTLRSVVSVTYVDTAGATQTFSDYVVAGQRIVVGDSGWPSTDSVPHAVTVRFTAGYGDAAAVPVAIKRAILLDVEDAYRNRGVGGEELKQNPAYLRLLRPYMVRRL